jgi:hypothetical protein
MPCSQRQRLGDVAAFETRLPVTVVKFIIKSSLFNQMPRDIRPPKLKLISRQMLSKYSSPRHIAKPAVGCG